MTDTKDIVHEFGAFAASARYGALPEAAREAARKSILDTLGVILAASVLEPAARGAIALVDEMGGAEQSTLLSLKRRVPALMAAYGNGALAHCLDYDDQTPWGQHAASSVVPAVLAVAERRGGARGQDIIAAVAVGQDIFARLRCNVGWLKDWNLSSVMGVFAGAAAAARVMQFSASQATNALGIASMQSSGVMEMVAGTGSDLRGLYAGFSAKGAVLAALMAERGVSGIDRLFEGQYGFFNTYFGGRYNREGLLQGLGRDFLGAGTLYKMWPSVGTAHSHMKATIDIFTQQDLRVEDVAEIRVSVGDYHSLMCQPLETRRAPRTLVDAKFSLPFLVAVAAVRRGMSVSDFTEAGLRDPRVLAAAAKVTPVADASLDWKLELPPGRVEVVCRDGRRFDAVGVNVPGGPEDPMTWAQVAAKFRDCAALAAAPNAQRAVDLAQRLEALDDGTEILRVLA